LISEYKENLPTGVYHTSLGDLPVDQIIQLSSQFDVIKLESQGFDFNSDVYKESLILHRYLCQQESNRNLDITQFTTHPDINSRSPQPTLWVFGCSHSYGTGLRPNEKRYAELVAEGMGLPLKLIARPGGSMQWTLRHIVNAAIEPRDFVIWQIINPPRTSYFNGKHVEEICFSHTKNRHLLEVYTDEQIYFTHLSTINVGVRYLRACQSQFMLISLDHNNEYEFRLEYSKYPEYYYCSDFAVDLGTDNLHYGPLSNKRLAITLLNHIQ
jgi:hypothetical protein